MRNAKPMEATAVVDEEDLGDEPASEVSGEPGYAPGFRPGEAPKSGSRAGQSADEILAAPQHGTKPTNPQSGPYGPFQRWSYFARFLNYPISTIGKLFFSLGSGNFVCSASVIGTNAVITAGHCNSDGSGTFATNRLFCPSFNAATGVNPETGCWGVVNSVVSNQWHNSGDPDYDYSVLRAANTGSVHNTSIGIITGALGHAWNFGSSQAEQAFGYPQGAPFAGNRIIQVATTEWYDHDFTSGTQVSKVVGNDMRLQRGSVDPRFEQGERGRGHRRIGRHRPGQQLGQRRQQPQALRDQLPVPADGDERRVLAGDDLAAVPEQRRCQRCEEHHRHRAHAMRVG